ncbi:MAG: hypothetical protein ACOX6P_11435 [Candidatus Merdivicinus sp.]|jgi:hypothetical protein
MKSETKLTLIVWGSFMLGLIYACVMPHLPSGWKWAAWLIEILALIGIMILTDRVLIDDRFRIRMQTIEDTWKAAHKYFDQKGKLDTTDAK